MSQNGLTWAWQTHSKQQTTETNGKISSEISTVPPRLEKELRDKKEKKKEKIQSRRELEEGSVYEEPDLS